MEMLLLITVQFVNGQADYVLTDDMPIFMIFLAAADFHLFGNLKESIHWNDV